MEIALSWAKNSVIKKNLGCRKSVIGTMNSEVRHPCAAWKLIQPLEKFQLRAINLRDIFYRVYRINVRFAISFILLFSIILPICYTDHVNARSVLFHKSMPTGISGSRQQFISISIPTFESNHFTKLRKLTSSPQQPILHLVVNVVKVLWSELMAPIASL